MKKLLVVLALLLVATPAMASLELSLEYEFNNTARQLYVDAVITGNTFAPDVEVSVFQAGMLLSGTDAALFTPFMAPVRDRTAAQMNSFLGGDFAFVDWVGKSNAQVLIPAWGFVSEGIDTGELDENWNPIIDYHNIASYTSGTAVRFVFSWAAENDAAVAAVDDLVLTLVDFNLTPGSLPTLMQAEPYVRLPVTVANNNLAVPEPATMGLLGLGLVGLIARRRSRK